MAALIKHSVSSAVSIYRIASVDGWRVGGISTSPGLAVLTLASRSGVVDRATRGEWATDSLSSEQGLSRLESRVCRKRIIQFKNSIGNVACRFEFVCLRTRTPVGENYEFPNSEFFLYPIFHPSSSTDLNHGVSIYFNFLKSFHDWLYCCKF